MRRLFNCKDNKLLDVAIDHGVFNEDRFLDGIEGGINMLCVFARLRVSLSLSHRHADTQTHAHARTHTRTYTRTCTRTCTHIHTPSYTHTHTHTSTYSRTCIHTYTHMQTQQAPAVYSMCVHVCVWVCMYVCVHRSEHSLYDKRMYGIDGNVQSCLFWLRYARHGARFAESGLGTTRRSSGHDWPGVLVLLVHAQMELIDVYLPPASVPLCLSIGQSVSLSRVCPEFWQQNGICACVCVRICENGHHAWVNEDTKSQKVTGCVSHLPFICMCLFPYMYRSLFIHVRFLFQIYRGYWRTSDAGGLAIKRTRHSATRVTLCILMCDLTLPWAVNMWYDEFIKRRCDLCPNGRARKSL